MRAENEKKRGYSGGQYFIQETHYHGQPYTQYDMSEKQSASDSYTFRYQDLKSQSDFRMGQVGGGVNRESSLSENAFRDREIRELGGASRGSMSTLSEKDQD